MGGRCSAGWLAGCTTVDAKNTVSFFCRERENLRARLELEGGQAELHISKRFSTSFRFLFCSRARSFFFSRGRGRLPPSLCSLVSAGRLRQSGVICCLG